MRTARIGQLEVSVIGLGCNNFGRALDEAGSAAVVNAALDVGINHFDTASNYGNGKSESFLGAALGDRRADVVISTKFGVPVPGLAGSGGARPEYVRQSIERSLSELRTDYVDLFMLHKPDPETPIADTLGAMQALVDAGTVREIGCSNLNATQLQNALATASDLGHAAFVCNQMEYSLVRRDPETNGVVESCRDGGVALLPFYPLASGLLTGKTRRGEPPKGRLSMDRYQRYLTDANFDIAERLESYCADHAIPMVHVALGWLIAHDFVPSVTPGATTSEQVRTNAGAADWLPTSEDLVKLETHLAGV